MNQLLRRLITRFPNKHDLLCNNNNNKIFTRLYYNQSLCYSSMHGHDDTVNHIERSFDICSECNSVLSTSIKPYCIEQSDASLNEDEIDEYYNVLLDMQSTLQSEIHTIDITKTVKHKINTDTIDDKNMIDICKNVYFGDVSIQQYQSHEICTEKISKLFAISNVKKHFDVRVTVDYTLEKHLIPHMGIHNVNCKISYHHDKGKQYKLLHITNDDVAFNQQHLHQFKKAILADKLSNHDFVWLLSFLCSHPSNDLFDVVSQNMTLD